MVFIALFDVHKPKINYQSIFKEDPNNSSIAMIFALNPTNRLVQ